MTDKINLDAHQISGLVIDSLSGQCPVQAEGTIMGRPFYFRARGNRWSFEVENQLTAQASYGEERYAAGYMPPNEAIAFIVESAIAWKARTAHHDDSRAHLSRHRQAA